MEFVFYKTTKFKETPIGEVPKDWKVVRLKNVAKIIMGQSPPSSTYNKKGEGLPFLQGKAEFGFIYPSPVTYCSKPIKIAKANDILISVRAPVGDVNLTPCRICIGRGLAAIRFNNKVASYLFYFYYLQKVKKFLESLGKGSTFKAIVKDDLESLAVPLPPLPEQKAIAHILSTVDEAIQKTNEIIEKTKRLKKGLMQELLTKGIGHKEFKDTEIGRIPKEWEVVRLRDLVKRFVSGGTPSTKEPRFWNGDIPWITSAHITKWYVDSGERYITKEGLERSATNIVPKGNVIVATRVGIGKSAFNLIDIAINQDLTGLIIDKHKVNAEFLVWYLISPRVIRILLSFTRGTTIKGISRRDLERLKVPLPSLSEQQKIAKILSTVDKRLEIERKRKEKLERIKKALMDLLLTGKIRIKVKEYA